MTLRLGRKGPGFKVNLDIQFVGLCRESRFTRVMERKEAWSVRPWREIGF